MRFLPLLLLASMAVGHERRQDPTPVPSESTPTSETLPSSSADVISSDTTEPSIGTTSFIEPSSTWDVLSSDGATSSDSVTSETVTSEPITTVPPTLPPSSEPTLDPSANATSFNPNATSFNPNATSFNPNATSVSTSISPNATDIPDVELEEEGNGDDAWDISDDQIPLPPEMKVDEMVLTLAYTANQDKSRCQKMADDMARDATTNVRRHLAHLDYRRRRRSLVPKRCLPATLEIPVTFHWVVPKNVSREDWINRSALEDQIRITRGQLSQMLNAALLVRGYWWWQSDQSQRFTYSPKNNIEWAKSWVKAVKERAGSTAYSHLSASALLARVDAPDVFIVEDAGTKPDSGYLNGFANFPGSSELKDYVDGVVVGAYTIFNNRNGIKSRTPRQPKVGDTEVQTNFYDRWGTTLAHEIGHWLGLSHPHSGGCKGNDHIAETPQYGPSDKPDYTYTCEGKYMGEKGMDEHNVMAYSNGRTRDKGFFNDEQLVRAFVGYYLRRYGLTAEKRKNVDTEMKSVTERYLPKCKASLKKRDFEAEAEEHIDIPRYLPALTKRQTAEMLQKFCDNTELAVENHDFSEYAERGLYNPDSPALPNQPPPPQLENVDPGSTQEAEGEKGSNIDQVQEQVEERVGNTGSIAPKDPKADIPEEFRDGGVSGNSGEGGGDGSNGNGGSSGNGGSGSGSGSKSGAITAVASGALIALGMVVALW